MTKDILLVEYDESTVHFIKELFPAPLFEVTVANDGETAKRKLADKNFDLMITAAMLPRFHGFNLALAVAQEYPLIKIIVISAIYKGFYYKHQAISQYRADDFFEKPLDKASFKSRVLELLNLSAADLQSADSKATPGAKFDTAKIQAVGKTENEEKQLSADDIFGDLIKNIDKVPQHKIDLNAGPAPKNDMPAKAAPPPPPVPKIEPIKIEPPLMRAVERPDPGQTMMPNNFGETRHAPAEIRKQTPSSQSINDNLDSLRQTVIKQAPENKMRKIEDDIARRFEDTLSGLGLGLQPPKPAPKPNASPVEKPAPAFVPPPAPKIISPENEKIADDEIIIELGTESLQQEIEAKPAPEIRKTVEREEPKPEIKAAPAENPNELGDYVLLGMIARGGMAEIYKAKRKGVKGFEKVIAIKKILSGYGEDDKYIEMLVDEAKIAAELSHPNIVQIYDLGRKDNYYFIAMEYVLGKDLREIQGRLREKDQWFPEEISLFLTIKILEALNYAHKAKDSHGHALEIVHRDVSPPNILISYNGDVKLTDFGISKASIKLHHTISGALKGKLLYMSPEQARGEGTIDCRSDLYSAGVVLFELLTSRKLFLDTSEMGVLKKVQNGEIINPRELNPDIDPALEKIILKSLSKACDKRYQSAAAMIAELETYMVKKYNYLPGPVQLSHFIYRLFEKDIVRDGVKVDLKPLPEKPLLREIPKVQPEPLEPPKPAPAKEIKAPEAPPAPIQKPAPLQATVDKREEVMHIDFDEDKVAPVKKPVPAFIRQEAVKPAPMFSQIHEDKAKKKSPLLPIALVLILMAAAALVYFLVLKKPAATESQAVAKPVQEEKTAARQPGVTAQPPIADLQRQAAENQKREEELQQQLEAAAAEEAALKQKLQEEKRTRQLEADRLKKEETDRLKQEEQQRLQQEEADKKQEEIDRLAREAQERKKAEEQKELERKRIKEGDVVPLSAVDKQPQVISQPDPIIPLLIRSSLPGNQTVRLNIQINQNGDVVVATLLQKTTNSQLNGILLDTIKTWKYSPAIKDGVRVKVWKTVSLIIKK